MKLVLLRVIFCSLIVTLVAISPVLAFSPNEIAVVYNTDSSIVNESQGVALYYAQARGIPQQNIVGISTRTVESVPATEYVPYIATPISNYLSTHPNIKVIVLCYGIPFRISGTPHGSVDAAFCSSDSAPGFLLKADETCSGKVGSMAVFL